MTESGLSLRVLRDIRPSPITLLENAVALLEQARTLEESRQVHIFARTVEEYIRAEKLGNEAEEHAYRLRLLAARRTGQHLATMKETGARANQGSHRKKVSGTSSSPPTLTDLGITRDLATRWQRIAALSQDEFERRLTDRWGETAMARTAEQQARIPNGIHKKVQHERGRVKGPTLRQSLRGLEQVAVQVQGLAEGLEGDLYGDWARLYALDEAQPFFNVIAEALPVVSARLKRALKERGKG